MAYKFNETRFDGVGEMPAVTHGYRVVLGLAPGEPFGSYCSACNPIWYTDSGHYGLGPRPADYMKKPDRHRDDAGQWHGDFERMFLPKGLFHTNEDGNLVHIETLEYPGAYALPAEDPGPPRYKHPEGRLPRPETPEAYRWKRSMAILAMGYHQNPETRAAVDARGGLIALVQKLVDAKADIQLEPTVLHGKSVAETLGEMPKLKEEPQFNSRQGGRSRARGSMMAVAAMAAAVIGSSDSMPRRRHEPEERTPTKEEQEAAAARSMAKRLAADEKRRRRAEKRQPKAK